jgi:uncharacterized membrane protein
VTGEARGGCGIRHRRPVEITLYGGGPSQARVASVSPAAGHAGPGDDREDTYTMATLTVWRFGTVKGAEEASETLRTLASQQLITVHDAATVSWEEGTQSPKTHQVHNLAATGALGGAFWGMLFGLVFFVPLLGAAIGAAPGALSGSLTDVGIDDGFINRVRDKVTPGTSALFVLSSEAVADQVKEALAGQHRPELLFTNLDERQEAALREVFEI